VSPESLVASLPGGLAGRMGAMPGRRRMVLTRCRVLLLAGRAEGGRLARSPLILAALAVVAAAIWRNSRSEVPLWWGWDMTIGSWLLIPAGAVLIAAQLAAGRARRDGMAQLYESYPVPAAARTGSQLLGVAGPVALAAVLTAAAILWLDSRGAIGAPRLTVLLAGLLLIALGGAVGVALGSWLPHPMAGILAAVVLGVIEVDLVLPEPVPVALPGQAPWLFPWTEPAGLGSLPGTVNLVPAGAHAAELAGLAGVAAVIALWHGRPARRSAGARRLTAALALAGAGCLAVAGWGSWAQLQPVPLTKLTRLTSDITQPARAERCETRGGTRYCAYPAFVPAISRWAVPVSGVLRRVPALHRTLVVRQVVDNSNELILTVDGTNDLGLTPATPPTAWGRQLARLSRAASDFEFAQMTNPRLVPGTSVPPVYTDLVWGEGSGLGASELGLASSTAYWVVGLPTTSRYVSYRSASGSGTQLLSCVPVGQAREAIALWLAAGATPAARAALAATLAAGPFPTQVGKRWIATYNLSGSGPALNLDATAQGTALAGAMLKLPARQVRAVLAAHWPGWLRPRATVAQLAVALRIALPKAPAVSSPPGSPPGSEISYGPPSPVCR
jgi:hypothetical protein